MTGRRAFIAAALAGMTVVTLCALKLGHMVVRQDRYWFFPLPGEVGNYQPAHLNFEDAWIDGPRGHRLHGWYVEVKNPTAVILLCHGSGGNLSREDGVLDRLTKIAGASVLLFDYEGYGKSEGDVPDEQGFYDDARAARDWLAHRAKVAPTSIVVLGRSLGAAVAVHLAARDGARGLIVQNGFSSLVDVSAHHYWWAPIHPFLRYRFENVEMIKSHQGPLLQSHAEKDRVVPLSMGQRLSDAAPGRKTFLILPGLDHGDPEPDDYYLKLREFLASLPP